MTRGLAFMQMFKVVSSTIDSLGWDHGVLLVQFNTGETVTHLDVPIGVFEEFRYAQSHSSYYEERIRWEYRRAL